ncbi:DNA-binding protein [Bacillus pseudomycoides]|uniref:DNA-binding protein n=1 Tax=Bacillus pseudomycoides TaxID=64104 RepID=A0AA91ZSL5_9BACI|nr:MULTISPECIES: helix-turn-helix domain-containing protein [Bacillus]PEB52138.1 DNA-binding protein [Bacillus sp. AFS098217]PED81477.1 DNA-binding protein [Bacillus pseudomycoides]PEU11470.1 DNA-binding protein [Bacillus sp. AFS019443]PEU12691.1 DNA-binding protein [Bacillus sp. AFS014408]PFW58601.1 DNA-binding protein [Bacillus sp. AFS075034]
MSEGTEKSNLGLLLKELLKEQSLSMRKLSTLTGIDTATISMIINGKRKANPKHLQKFADCLGIPITDLFVAAGYSIETKQEKQSDIHVSIDNIQHLLESSHLYDQKFSIANVKQQLANYEQYSQTEEGKGTILKGFEEKIQKVSGIGPFISDLKDLYEKFIKKKGTRGELALMGSALIYFILAVDVIPDYVFPIGYLDDAVAVQIVLNLLLKR